MRLLSIQERQEQSRPLQLHHRARSAFLRTRELFQEQLCQLQKQAASVEAGALERMRQQRLGASLALQGSSKAQAPA